jgi:hypothetical protein
MPDNDMSKEEEAAMEAAQERSAIPHLRDVLKREHNEARPRNEALEKWGPMIEEEIMRDMAKERQEIQSKHPDKLPKPVKHPKKDGPDMDMG